MSPLVVRQATPSPLIKCNQILHLLHQQTHSLDSTRTTCDLIIDTPCLKVEAIGIQSLRRTLPQLAERLF